MTTEMAFIIFDLFGMIAMVWLIFYITVRLDEKEKQDEEDSN